MSLYAITSSNSEGRKVFWHGTHWSADVPPTNFQGAHLSGHRSMVQAELNRLKESLRHDTSLRIVDTQALGEYHKAWAQALGARAAANGYGIAQQELGARNGRTRALRIDAIKAANRMTYGMGLLRDEAIDVGIGTETDLQLEWIVATRLGMEVDFRGYDLDEIVLVHRDMELDSWVPVPRYARDFQRAFDLQLDFGLTVEPDESGPTRLWKAHRKGAEPPMFDAISESPAKAIAMAVARDGRDELVRIPRALATERQIEAAEQRLNPPPAYPRQR